MSTLNATDLFAVRRGSQTYKVSYQDVLAGVVLPSVLTYMGATNPAAAAPAPAGGLKAGMTYVLTPAGTLSAGWTGIAGINATDGQLAIWEGAKWELIGNTGAIPHATEAVSGIVELATAAETTTGTDNTRAVHPAGLKVELDKKAPLASPALTGTPTAPTAAAGTNTTQLATTAFVAAADKWTRTGTTLSPKTAGDVVHAPLVPTNGALGSRNAVINGMVNINQRGVTIAAAAVGTYGPDRWKKVDAGNMTQIIEDGNFVPGATYTLSGTGVTTRQLTAPGTGNWTLPSIPIAATNIQLEQGPVATPFEHRTVGLELMMCQRYYQASPLGALVAVHTNPTVATVSFRLGVEMRASPTIAQATTAVYLIPMGPANVTDLATTTSTIDLVVCDSRGVARIRLGGFATNPAAGSIYSLYTTGKFSLDAEL